MAEPIKVNAMDALSGMEMTVRVSTREAVWRLRIAGWLFALAGRVLKTGVRVEFEE